MAATDLQCARHCFKFLCGLIQQLSGVDIITSMF